jgi:hypothetical protein
MPLIKQYMCNSAHPSATNPNDVIVHVVILLLFAATGVSYVLLRLGVQAFALRYA